MSALLPSARSFAVPPRAPRLQSGARRPATARAAAGGGVDLEALEARVQALEAENRKLREAVEELQPGRQFSVGT